MKRKMKYFTADFETTVVDFEDEYQLKDVDKESRVWSWGVCEVGKPESFLYGTDINTFMDWCREENRVVYFHNLKFDAQFIIYWLFQNGFTYSNEKTDNTFNCLISRKGDFYSVEVIYKKKNKKYEKVTFLDSHKKLPFKVSRIAEAFKLPIMKGEIDYKKDRPSGYIPTPQEIEYLRNDVTIMSLALAIQFGQGLTRMTVGSDALNEFKTLFGKQKFKTVFPRLPVEVDNRIRLAYRGGFTYVNDRFAGKDIKSGLVFDVNSMYPWVLYEKMLPYSRPMYFIGQYEEDEFYPLYIQTIRCTFELKKGKIPTIQKKGDLRFGGTEYIIASGLQSVDLTLTNVDMELFFENYEVLSCEYIDGWKFKGVSGLFTQYIEKWMKIKETSTGAMRELAKLMLNSLYGKFASNPEVTGMVPYLEDDVVHYDIGETDFREPVYTALSVFVTAYARHEIISRAQSLKDRFLYADTDSLHIAGTHLPKELDVHESRLGAWKFEGEFVRARYLRPKTYIEEMLYVDKETDEEYTKLEVTCAGMPDEIKKDVTWENFKVGFKRKGKLVPVRVKGGVVLKPIDFSIN